MGETTKKAMLKTAAERIGTTHLAIELGSPVHLIEAWINGHATMPDRKFLLLVDLIDELNSKS